MKNLPTELFLALQSARTKKEILFRFHRCSSSPAATPIRRHPPPSLRFPLSLIESSNFRLHSPSACLLCRPVRIQRTLCRNLGTRTRWRVHSPGADSRLKKRGEGETKRKRGKIKNQGKMRSRVIPIATERSRLCGKTNGLRCCHREEIWAAVIYLFERWFRSSKNESETMFLLI